MADFTYTYTSLVARMQEYVEDDSTEFQAELPDIINRAELKLVRDLDLSVFNTRTSGASLTASTATQNKPSGALIIDSIWLTSSRKWVKPRSTDYVTAYDSGTEAEPVYYADPDPGASTYRVAPAPDQAYTVDIWSYSRPDKLESGTTETNWLTDNVPDVLFNAVMVEAERFLVAPERAAEFKAAYQETLASALIEFRRYARDSYQFIERAAQPLKP